VRDLVHDDVIINLLTKQPPAVLYFLLSVKQSVGGTACSNCLHANMHTKTKQNKIRLLAYNQTITGISAGQARHVPTAVLIAGHHEADDTARRQIPKQRVQQKKGRVGQDTVGEYCGKRAHRFLHAVSMSEVCAVLRIGSPGEHNNRQLALSLSMIMASARNGSCCSLDWCAAYVPNIASAGHHALSPLDRPGEASRGRAAR